VTIVSCVVDYFLDFRLLARRTRFRSAALAKLSGNDAGQPVESFAEVDWFGAKIDRCAVIRVVCSNDLNFVQSSLSREIICVHYWHPRRCNQMENRIANKSWTKKHIDFLNNPFGRQQTSGVSVLAKKRGGSFFNQKMNLPQIVFVSSNSNAIYSKSRLQ